MVISFSVVEIKIDDYVTISGSQLKFNAYTSQSCVKYNSSTPQPTPVPWYMPTPAPYSSPEPEPMKSPNPINLIHNDTHYVYINLEELKQDVLKTNTSIFYTDYYRPVHFEFVPFKQTSCPDSYGECPPHTGNANAYLCYTTASLENVCYPYADVYYDSYLSNLPY